MRLIVRATTRGRGVALCLHRVGGEFDEHQLFPELTQPASDIDELVSYFASCPQRLTVTFDDAYADSVEYVASRAGLHPSVNWMVNICARKTLERSAHMWDVWADTGRPEGANDFLDEWQQAVDRGSLTFGVDHGLADDERYLLATAERCREVDAFDNVTLGNHTDHHLPMSWLQDEILRDEIVESEKNFRSEFGSSGHLALPFGCEPYVGRDDIARITSVAELDVVWTVHSRPFRAGSDRINGVDVRPRFGWGDGDLAPRAMALFIAVKCVVDRLGRSGDRSTDVVSLPEIAEPVAEPERSLA